MNSLMVRLWNDDCGYILSAESAFLFTITVIGLVAGWTSLRNSVAAELVEVGHSIHALSQCYSISGLTSCGGGVCGQGVTDTFVLTTLAQSAPVTVTVEVSSCP